MLDYSPLIGISGGTSLLLLLAALALDFVVSVSGFSLGPKSWNSPHRGVGSIFIWLEKKLNRENRSEANRVVRGAIVALIALSFSIGVGLGLWWIAHHVPYGWGLEFLLLFLVVGQRRVLFPLRRVGRELHKSGPDVAREIFAGLWPGYDREMDKYGCVRFAIEEGTLAFGRSVIGPVFWFVLLGLPGLVVYWSVCVMAGALNSIGGRAEAFSMAAARLDGVFHFFPSRIAAILLLVAGFFVPHASLKKGLSVMLTDGSRHPAFAGGWILGVTAGILGLALCGPSSRYAGVLQNNWIGDGRARAGYDDIRRALYLSIVGCLVHASIVAGLLLFRLVV